MARRGTTELELHWPKSRGDVILREMPGRRLALAALGLASLAGIAGDPVMRRVRAVQLLRELDQAAKVQGAERALSEREVVIPGGERPVRARLYTLPGHTPSRGLVIAHGVHYRGIDEARLVPFARALARTGRAVLTPELADLADYRITERSAEDIARSARWLSERADLVDRGKVGVLGFSFAGGLALVAAERPELEGRLEFVTSVGGHHDLSRVLDFFVSDRVETPEGVIQAKAHEYGLVVLLYQYLDHFVDEADRPALADALRSWLREDRASAWAAASRRTTASGERLFRLLVEQRLRELAPELRRLLVERRPVLSALSPRGRLRRLGVPVYLLHGSADSVIPPSETNWAARELEGREHLALVSPLIQHVEVNGAAGLRDELLLVDFIARLL